MTKPPPSLLPNSTNLSKIEMLSQIELVSKFSLERLVLYFLDQWFVMEIEMTLSF